MDKGVTAATSAQQEGATKSCQHLGSLNLTDLHCVERLPATAKFQPSACVELRRCRCPKSGPAPRTCKPDRHFCLGPEFQLTFFRAKGFDLGSAVEAVALDVRIRQPSLGQNSSNMLMDAVSFSMALSLRGVWGGGGAQTRCVDHMKNAYRTLAAEGGQ